jgi:hypothetical protein
MYTPFCLSVCDVHSILSVRLWCTLHFVCSSVMYTPFCLSVSDVHSILSVRLWCTLHFVCPSLMSTPFCLSVCDVHSILVCFHCIIYAYKHLCWCLSVPFQLFEQVNEFTVSQNLLSLWTEWNVFCIYSPDHFYSPASYLVLIRCF